VSEFVYRQADLLFHSVNFLACHAWTFMSRRSLLVILRAGQLCRTLYYGMRSSIHKLCGSPPHFYVYCFTGKHRHHH
jgi:hypothetical protein